MPSFIVFFSFFPLLMRESVLNKCFEKDNADFLTTENVFLYRLRSSTPFLFHSLQ